MNKDIFTCMRDSHSVRHFTKEPIPDEIVTQLLQAANWAPSAGNLQPWYLYVVKDEKIKQEVAKVCYNQPQVEEAAVLIVVLADPAKSNEQYGERGAQLYCLQDSAAAVQNMLLAAEALGIGACWVGAFDEVKLQRIVEAAPRLRAVAVVCIGKSDEEVSAMKDRRRVEEIAKFVH